jgi:hypothetical protein
MSPSKPMGIGLMMLMVCAADLAAQWPSEVTPGTRIRIRLPETQYQMDGPRGHLLRGRVAALSGDTVYLAVTDSVGSLAIPRAMIQRLDVSRGAPSRGVSALQRGAITAVGGALWGLLAGSLDESNDVDTEDAMLVGGGIGLAVGGVLGAIFPRERWKRVRSEGTP